jgi:hypothetical protein
MYEARMKENIAMDKSLNASSTLAAPSVTL